MNKLEHGKNLRKQGILTNWRAEIDIYVRIWEKIQQERGTYFLVSADEYIRTQKESKKARGTYQLNVDYTDR